MHITEEHRCNLIVPLSTNSSSGNRTQTPVQLIHKLAYRTDQKMDWYSFSVGNVDISEFLFVLIQKSQFPLELTKCLDLEPPKCFDNVESLKMSALPNVNHYNRIDY